MAAAMPLPQARPSFLQHTRAFCKLLYAIGSPEVRAATFIFENTICYQEFETSKRLTLDEFVNGRKRSNGERLGSGCGFSDRGNASKALKKLEERGAIAVDSDERDGARKKKFYRLTLPSLINGCCQIDNTNEQDTAILPTNVVEMTTQSCQVDSTVLSDSQLRVVEMTTRTEEGRGEVLREVPKESTLYAADAAVDTVVSVEMPEEEDSTMHPGAVVTSDDDYPFKPLQFSKQERQRSKLRRERPQPSLFASSDSQTHAGLSESTAAPESAADPPTPTTPENPEIVYYRDLLAQQRKSLQEEEAYLATCASEDKSRVQWRVEQLRVAVANAEQTLLELRPAPALDDSNWQQQIFGGLCKIVDVAPEKISDTPLAKTLGQAATKIKSHKRRPDELPSMWHRFRTDRRFSWMNGRGDIGKLILLFASNAAVL